MSRDRSTTTTVFDGDNQDNDSTVVTEGQRPSDSIMLKKDAKGVMSWEIKVYGDFTDDTEIGVIRNKATQINSDLCSQFGIDSD